MPKKEFIRRLYPPRCGLIDDEQRLHEEATIKAFIAPLRRHRVLELLANPKRRKTITSELAHFKWLDPRFATVISGSGSASRRIFDLLKSKGAGETCWLISESPDLDGRKMSLAL